MSLREKWVGISYGSLQWLWLRQALKQVLLFSPALKGGERVLNTSIQNSKLSFPFILQKKKKKRTFTVYFLTK